MLGVHARMVEVIVDMQMPVVADGIVQNRPDGFMPGSKS